MDDGIEVPRAAALQTVKPLATAQGARMAMGEAGVPLCTERSSSGKLSGWILIVVAMTKHFRGMVPFIKSN